MTRHEIIKLAMQDLRKQAQFPYEQPSLRGKIRNALMTGMYRGQQAKNLLYRAGDALSTPLSYGSKMTRGASPITRDQMSLGNAAQQSLYKLLLGNAAGVTRKL